MKKANIILSNVLYAPSIKHNLISISKLDTKIFETKFKTSDVTIGKKGRVFVRGENIDNMYCIVISGTNNNILYVYFLF